MGHCGFIFLLGAGGQRKTLRDPNRTRVQEQRRDSAGSTPSAQEQRGTLREHHHQAQEQRKTQRRPRDKRQALEQRKTLLARCTRRRSLRQHLPRELVLRLACIVAVSALSFESVIEVAVGDVIAFNPGFFEKSVQGT